MMPLTVSPTGSGQSPDLGEDVHERAVLLMRTCECLASRSARSECRADTLGPLNHEAACEGELTVAGHRVLDGTARGQELVIELAGHLVPGSGLNGEVWHLMKCMSGNVSEGCAWT